MDGLVQCNRTRASTRSVTGRISDHSSRVTADSSAWTDSRILQLIRRIYFTIISILLSCIFISDLGLYGYWGFRLDTTPLFYFFSSPKDALASVSLWVVAGGILAMAVYAALLYFVFSWILVNEKRPLKIPYRRLSVSGVLLLATGLLFIPIRGGFSVSTMNLGRVFFSADQRLNHAAINPAFSLLVPFPDRRISINNIALCLLKRQIFIFRIDGKARDRFHPPLVQHGTS